MMIKPGISSLEKCVEDGCRYVLVTVAAKRARMLGKKDGSNMINECMVQCDSDNPVTQAIAEISAGKVSYKSKN
ncbi:MAG: DNA-directed RNA polymerase subunit omega [Clostridia bacterium]|nr:DNA-directed RNA polymerase subunit omega [Clostridia bacterium]